MNDDCPTSFRARIDELLDRRLDPLDDDEVVAFLERHPEQLDALADERAWLRHLAEPGADRQRWLQPIPAGIAAAGLIAAGLFAAGLFAWSLPGPDAPPAPPRILSATIDVRAPSLQPSYSYRVREPLLRTPSTTLELFAHVTERR